MLHLSQLATNWRLALVLSTTIPLITLTGGTMDTIMAKTKQAQLESNGKGATLVEEAYSSVRTVKAFSSEDVLVRLYDKFNAITYAVLLFSLHSLSEFLPLQAREGSLQRQG
jgi:ABC-type bacteriocin/lantibiotic exporter with double-glycine peptidase domain